MGISPVIHVFWYNFAFKKYEKNNHSWVRDMESPLGAHFSRFAARSEAAERWASGEHGWALVTWDRVEGAREGGRLGDGMGKNHMED